MVGPVAEFSRDAPRREAGRGARLEWVIPGALLEQAPGRMQGNEGGTCRHEL